MGRGKHWNRAPLGPPLRLPLPRALLAVPLLAVAGGCGQEVIPGDSFVYSTAAEMADAQPRLEEDSDNADSIYLDLITDGDGQVSGDVAVDGQAIDAPVADSGADSGIADAAGDGTEGDAMADAALADGDSGEADGALADDGDGGDDSDGDGTDGDVSEEGGSEDAGPADAADSGEGDGAGETTSGPCGGKPNGSHCEDGNACTVGDACAAGTCTAGKGAPDCDDSNPCTDDGCDAAKGCVHLANTATCTDGDACTGPGACGGGECATLPLPATACDDANLCTDDGCKPGSGCVHLANTATCTDGDVCTGEDMCTGSSCKAGAAVAIDDGNPCTDDGCEAMKGVTHLPNKATCDDGDACTQIEVCAAAKCGAGKPVDCSDGNPCTEDACAAKTGCGHKALANGAACEDGSACTLADACKGGVCAAGYEKLWDKTWGGGKADGFNAAIALPGGAYAVVGHTASKGAGKNDGWILRIDAAGTTAWETTAGGAGDDVARAVVALPGGGLGVVGETSSGGAGKADAWLLRFDAGGKKVLEKSYGGAAEDAANSVAVMDNGDLVLAGYNWSKKPANLDGWLLRTDPEGAVLWDKSPGGPGFDVLRAVRALPGGGLAAAGGATPPGGPGGYDAWLVRTDAKGTTLWDRTWGGAGNEQAATLAVLPDAGYLLAGYTTSKGSGKHDGWLLQIDGAGTMRWERTYGGAEVDTFQAVVAIPGGGYALAGSTISQGKGSYDLWLLGIDTLGNALWERTRGGAGADAANALLSVAGGGLLVAGSRSSAAGAGSDAWLIRTDAWGHVSCAESGPCANKKPADCDDQNPCTADLCDAKKGCVHEALADGAACESGKACAVLDTCKVGKCQGGKDKLWDRTFGGVGNDAFFAMVPVDDGFVLAGATQSKGAGSYDMWLSRVDSAGNLLWERAIGASGADWAKALVADKGGFAIVGKTDSQGAGSSDMWLVRTDGTGKPLWNQTYGGKGNEAGTALVATIDGFVLAGITTSKGAGGKDMWLVRADSAGKPTWDQTYGGSGEDWVLALVAVSGGFALLGETASKGAGKSDMWLVRTDGKGKLLWDRTFGGQGTDRAFAMVPVNEGFALAGYLHPKGAGAADMWLVRTDGEGKLLWERSYGGSGHEEADALVTVDDGLAVAGVKQKNNTGQYDMWLLRVDGMGNALWSKTFGGSERDDANALLAVPGGFVLAGDTWSKGAGKEDGWLIRTDRWGHATCHAAGPCAGKKPADCDDKNPCTADLCDAKAACTHKTLPDASPCETGKPCTAGNACKNGACQGGGPSLWDASFGGKQEDNLTDVVVLADGSVAAVGYRAGNKWDGSKSWLVRANPGGAAVVDLSYPDRRTVGIAVLGKPVAGGPGLILAGSKKVAGAKKTDGWLARVDLAGKIVWQQTFAGGTADAVLVQVLVRPAGVPGGARLVAAGATRGKDGHRDFWLLQTSMSGKLLKARAFETGYHDYLRGLAAAPDGGFALAGYRGVAAGDSDAWLVRTNSEGIEQWHQGYGGPGPQAAHAVASLADGGFALAGNTLTKGAGKSDGWLVRTNAAGKPLWDRTFGGGAYEELTAIVTLPDGGLVLAGSTTSLGAGKWDAWMVRTDAWGTSLWERSFGGPEHDVANAVALLGPGAPGGPGFLLAGYTGSKGAGGSDGWLLRVDPWGHLSCAEAGKCAGKPTSACDDKNPCTADVCDGKKGCLHAPQPDASPCDDGNACTTKDTCAKGTCKGGPPPNCNDGNVCTKDGCDVKKGCQHPAVADAAPCDDGSACTLADGCKGGACAAGVERYFDRTYGGKGGDAAYALVAIPQPGAGFLLAGWTDTKGDGNGDMLAVRTDEHGKALWQKTYGGPGKELALGAAPLKDGFALAGNTTSKGAGSYDGWIVRVDGQGKQVWDVPVGGTAHDSLQALAVLPGGALAAAGNTRSKGAGAADGWLVRLDAAGNVQDKHTYGGASTDGFTSVVRLPDGFALAGRTQSFGDIKGDAWLVRTDEAGALLWQRIFGNFNDDAAQSLVTIAGGDLAFGGVGYDKVAKTWRAWVVRTDAAGHMLWERKWGPNWRVYYHGLALMPDGGFAVAGYVPANGSGDGWLARLDSGGNLLWKRVFGGKGGQILGAAVALADGGIAAAGLNNGKGAGKSDAWLIRTDPWGHANCAQAGICAGLKPADCDDKNPCTADLCDAKTGCGYKAMSDGAACESGKACAVGESCKAGICQGGGPKLFAVGVGTAAADRVGAVVVLPNGYAFAGSTYEKADGSDADYLLVQTDAQGAQQWRKTYGGAAADAATSLVGLADGFALAGFSASTSAGTRDFWLIRTDGKGKQLWNRFYGGAGDDSSEALLAVPGGFVSAGATNSKGAGNLDAWLVRVDAAGNPVWDRTYGGTAYDVAHALTVPADGGFALLGISASKGAGGHDMWLVRTDSDGNALWDRTFGGAQRDDAGRTLVALPDGFALAGTTQSKGAGGDDVWLVRTDLAGAVLWDRTYGGSKNDWSPYLIGLADGFLLAGDTTSKGAGLNDLWLVRTDGLGNALWDRTYGTAGYDENPVLAVLPDGFFIAATSKQGFGGDDTWLLRTDRWGHATCKDAGPCANKKPADCDDKNPCTADLCDPKAGCTHKALPDASPCEAGKPCTLLDACKAGKCTAGPAKLWDKTVGGAKDDALNAAVALSPDAVGGPGLLAVGSTASKGQGGTDVWLVRLGLDGKVLWDKTFGSPGDEVARAVVRAPDGGFVIAGQTNAAGGDVDVWLIRTSAAGGLLWAKVLQGASAVASDIARSVAFVPGGLAGVAGFIVAGDQVRPKWGPNALVIRTSAKGTPLWKGAYGTVLASAYSVLYLETPEFGSAGFLVAGSQRARGATWAGALFRLDKDGKLVWTSTFGSVKPPGFPEEVLAVVAVRDPLFGAPGFVSTGYATEGLPNPSFRLVRTDANGKVLWKKVWGCVEPCFARAIVAIRGASSNGTGFALLGSTASKGAGKEDFWLLRTDISGARLWDRTFGGVGSDTGHAVVALPDGGFALAGSTASKGAGGNDGWLLRTDAWGYTSCAGSGLCIDKSVSACDDHSPCTIDACAPKTGCIHSNLLDGTSCGKGRICKGGKCAP